MSNKTGHIAQQPTGGEKKSFKQWLYDISLLAVVFSVLLLVLSFIFKWEAVTMRLAFVLPVCFCIYAALSLDHSVDEHFGE